MGWKSRWHAPLCFLHWTSNLRNYRHSMSVLMLNISNGTWHINDDCLNFLINWLILSCLLNVNSFCWGTWWRIFNLPNFDQNPFHHNFCSICKKKKISEHNFIIYISNSDITIFITFHLTKFIFLLNKRL